MRGDFGHPADPAILLIMGSGASMDWWEDKFCARLAAGRRFVIRYDHRDTGRSVTYQPGAPAYALRDLAADAVGLLDVFNRARAHLVGMSMGGAIGQLVALDHPRRVASLTLISTSPGGGDPDLPAMAEQAAADLMDATVPDWSDRSAVIDYGVFLARAAASRSRPFDEAAMRYLWGRVFDRTASMAASMTNHDLINGTDRWRERLRDLIAPTLVIHGTEDPILPYGHGLALVTEIPGARLLPLVRTGHELPPATWNMVIPAILKHTMTREGMSR